MLETYRHLSSCTRNVDGGDCGSRTQARALNWPGERSFVVRTCTVILRQQIHHLEVNSVHVHGNILRFFFSFTSRIIISSTQCTTLSLRDRRSHENICLHHFSPTTKLDLTHSSGVACRSSILQPLLGLETSGKVNCRTSRHVIVSVVPMKSCGFSG